MTDYLVNIDVILLKLVNVTAKNSLFDLFMPVITLGGSFYLVITAGLTIAFFVKKEKVYFAGSFVAVMFISLYAYRFMKVFFERQRPVFSHEWVNIIGFPLESYSFPSGHSTIAFTWAVFMSLKYPRGRIYYLTIAGLVAFSRVYMGVHYPSDVFAGAILGSLIALAWNAFFERIRGSSVKQS